jgi:hypothetical protein
VTCTSPADAQDRENVSFIGETSEVQIILTDSEDALIGGSLCI